MSERLREIAEMAAGVGIDLFRVELQRAGERQHLLAQRARSLHLTDLNQRRHQPECADGERALLARQTVVGLLYLVPQHELVDSELVGDRQHGGPDPRITAGKESE